MLPTPSFSQCTVCLRSFPLIPGMCKWVRVRLRMCTCVSVMLTVTRTWWQSLTGARSLLPPCRSQELKEWTQVIRLKNRYLSLRSHLAGPLPSFNFQVWSILPFRYKCHLVMSYHLFIQQRSHAHIIRLGIFLFIIKRYWHIVFLGHLSGFSIKVI